MSDRSFGFGTRSYMCKALRSFSAVPLFVESRRSVSSCDIVYAARRGVLSCPIIEKLCSGRVLSTSIFDDARWGSCVSGYSNSALKLRVPLRIGMGQILCAEISLLKKSGKSTSFAKNTTNVFCPGRGFLFTFPGRNQGKEVNKMSDNFVGGDSGALLELLGKLIIIISK